MLVHSFGPVKQGTFYITNSYEENKIFQLISYSRNNYHHALSFKSTGIYRNNFRNSNCKKYVLYRNNLAISMSLYIRSNLSIAARYQSQKPFENVENIRNILLNDLSLYIRKTLMP